MQQSFTEFLAQVSESIDELNTNHPNIKARTLLYEALWKETSQHLPSLNLDFGRLAVAVAGIKVSLNPHIAEGTLHNLVNVVCKGVVKGTLLYMDSLNPIHRAAAYDRGSEVLEAFLKQVTMEY